MYTTLLYYKYIDIDEPETILDDQRQLCKELGLKGRIVIGKEGINGTVEGLSTATDLYIQKVKENNLFADVNFKQSPSTGQAFPKLSIKVRDEIVSTHLDYTDKLGPHRSQTGKYITAQELHSWIHDEQKEFYLLDMRNDYEYAVGHFENSILPKNLRNFRDLPKILPEIEHLKDKTVVTCCTGGIRCEKASGFLIQHGFSDVYQLKDGIVTYMETYPNQDFLGKLYVFDQRIVMGFNLEDPEHKIVGKCFKCDSQSENLVDFYDNGERRYNIICQECITNQVVSLEK